MELSAFDSQALTIQDSLDDHLIAEGEQKGEEREKHDPFVSPPKRDWFRILQRYAIHLTPVSITAAFLQLNFRHIYWNDASFGNLNEYLGAFQVAAKLHEVLIIISLSHIVLYHLQRGLSSKGVPFGLFASAYVTFLGGLGLDAGYLYSCKAILGRRGSSSNNVRWRFLGLALLILLMTLLSLAVGPASAITVIPRLAWHDSGDLFHFFNASDTQKRGFPMIHTPKFDMYIPAKLFPLEVNKASLPGPCATADINGSDDCPFAGLDELTSTLDFSDSGILLPQNITIGASFGRRMFSVMGIIDPGYEDYGSCNTITSSFVLADYLSITSPQTGASFSLDTTTAYLAELHTSPTTMGPQVFVNCGVDTSARLIRNLTFLSPFYINSTSPNIQVDLRTIWDETTLANPPNRTLFKWKDMSNIFGASQMIGFGLRPKDEFGPSNVSICSIKAGWAPMKQWAISNGSPAVISNFSFDTVPLSYLHIDESWISAFNAVPNNGTSTVLETYIDNGLRILSNTLGSYEDFFPVAMAIIFSQGIADSLSRIGAQYIANSYQTNFTNVTVCRDAWCSQGPYATSNTGPVVLNGTYEDFDSYFEIPKIYRKLYQKQFLKSFPAPADIDDKWTRVSIPLKKYGYAYGFTTTTVKLAAAVLLFDVFIVLTHSIFLIVNGRTFSYAQSMGELLALAMNSPPTKAFKSGSEGISSSSAWGKSTTVQTHHKLKRLQIVVDD